MSWQGMGKHLPPPNISLCEKNFQKYKIWGWKSIILGESRGKIEILNTYMYVFSVGNLHQSVVKLQLAAPTNF